jgi:hypothetical protein
MKERRNAGGHRYPMFLIQVTLNGNDPFEQATGRQSVAIPAGMFIDEKELWRYADFRQYWCVLVQLPR